MFVISFQAGARVGRTDRNGRSALMFSVLFNRQRLTLLYTRTMDFDINQVHCLCDYERNCLRYHSFIRKLDGLSYWKLVCEFKEL